MHILRCLAALLVALCAAQNNAAHAKPPDAMPDLEGPAARTELATFGGGCFWCLEPLFEELKGVRAVAPGYAGGARPNPTYEQVCSGATGHAEVVQVTFDPDVISYEDLLRVFFGIHDPTTLNRQGADVGTQYRSVIFYHSAVQRAAAERIMAEVAEKGVWSRPLVTEVAPYKAFYVAEEYHHDYYRKNPGAGYCRIVIEPKVLKFRKEHAARLKQR